MMTEIDLSKSKQQQLQIYHPWFPAAMVLRGAGAGGVPPPVTLIKRAFDARCRSVLCALCTTPRQLVDTCPVSFDLVAPAALAVSVAVGAAAAAVLELLLCWRRRAAAGAPPGRASWPRPACSAATGAASASASGCGGSVSAYKKRHRICRCMPERM